MTKEVYIIRKERYNDFRNIIKQTTDEVELIDSQTDEQGWKHITVLCDGYEDFDTRLIKAGIIEA